MIKNISIFKVTEKKNEKSPDYRVTAKVGEGFIDVGAGWIKDSAKGKFISIKFKDQYNEQCGFALIEEDMKKLEGTTPTNSDGSPVPNFDSSLDAF